jgi:hypothetical protein
VDSDPIDPNDPRAGIAVDLDVPPDAKGWRADVHVLAVLNNHVQLITTDQANLISLLARQRFVKRISEQFHFNEQRIADFAKVLEEKWLEFYKQRLQEREDSKNELTAAERLEQMPKDIRLAASAMLEDPNLVDLISKDLQTMGIAGETQLAFTVYLVGVARLLENPLSARVHGPTASGKTYVPYKVARLLPHESIIIATRLTAQALYHMAPGSLVHKLILAGERTRVENDETAEATRALREMLTTGHLSKLMTVKVRGEMKTELIEQDGPIGYIESTSLSKVFDEDANRCLGLHTDETENQTGRIMRATAERYKRNGSLNGVDKIIAKHHAMHRMLRGEEVAVPYSVDLCGELKDTYKHVEMRRGFEHLMSTICASALLHQFQRDRDDNGCVVATRYDYEVAKMVLDEPLLRLLGKGVSAPAKRFYERLKTQTLARPFTVKEARADEKVSKAAVQAWFHELEDAGLLNVEEEARGRNPAKWNLTTKRQETVESVLPDAQKV